MAELTKEQRDILIKTAEYMVKRENTSEYSENIRKVAESCASQQVGHVATWIGFDVCQHDIFLCFTSGH